jgi:hypothetical protein
MIEVFARGLARVLLRRRPLEKLESEALRIAQFPWQAPDNALDDLVREYERRGFRFADLLRIRRSELRRALRSKGTSAAHKREAYTRLMAVECALAVHAPQSCSLPSLRREPARA